MTGNVLNGRKGPSEASRYVYAKFESPGVAFRARAGVKFVDVSGTNPTKQGAMQLSPFPSNKNGEYSGFVEACPLDYPSINMYPFGYARYWTGQVNGVWESIYAAFLYAGSLYDSVYYQGKSIYSSYALTECILAVSIVNKAPQGSPAQLVARMLCSPSSSWIYAYTSVPHGQKLYVKEVDVKTKEVTTLWTNTDGYSPYCGSSWGRTIVSISPDGKKAATVASYMEESVLKGGILVLSMETGGLLEFRPNIAGTKVTTTNYPYYPLIPNWNGLASDNFSAASDETSVSSTVFSGPCTVYYACQYDDNGELLVLSSTSRSFTQEYVRQDHRESLVVVETGADNYYKKAEKYVSNTTETTEVHGATVVNFWGTNVVVVSVDAATTATMDKEFHYDEERIGAEYIVEPTYTGVGSGASIYEETRTFCRLVAIDLRSRFVVLGRIYYRQHREFSVMFDMHAYQQYTNTTTDSSGNANDSDIITVSGGVVTLSDRKAIRSTELTTNNSYESTWTQISAVTDRPTPTGGEVVTSGQSFGISLFDMEADTSIIGPEMYYGARDARLGDLSGLAFTCKAASMGGVSLSVCPKFTGAEIGVHYYGNASGLQFVTPDNYQTVVSCKATVFAARDTGYNGEVPSGVYASGVDMELNAPVASFTTVPSVYPV